jgi:hypothetical protein
LGRLGRLKCSCRYRVTRPVEFAPAGTILHLISHSALKCGYKDHSGGIGSFARAEVFASALVM